MRKIADVQLNTSEGFFVQPIGNLKLSPLLYLSYTLLTHVPSTGAIESCYKQCIGTPRQGLLAPSSRSNLILTKNMSPGTFQRSTSACSLPALSSPPHPQSRWTHCRSSRMSGSRLSSTLTRTLLRYKYSFYIQHML